MPRAEPERGAAGDRGGLGRLEDASARLSRARQAEREAMAVERALRDEHLLEIERVRAQVQFASVGDRRKQEAIFPPARSRRRVSAREEAAPEAA